MKRKKTLPLYDSRTGRRRSPREVAWLVAHGYGAKSGSNPKKRQKSRDAGMMGYMKTLGYDIQGVIVPEGFADWSKERRLNYMELSAPRVEDTGML